MMLKEGVDKDIYELFARANLPLEELTIERCHQGGNNQTFKVQTSSGIFAVKKYFSHKSDTRNRLEAEFNFLCYANKVANGLVPKAYFHDPIEKIAFYEFIEGDAFINEPTLSDVDQAIAFFCKLNAPESKVHAGQLKCASEACFSIQEHIELIGERIKQIQNIPLDSEEEKEAAHFVAELKQAWDLWVSEIEKRAKNEHKDLSSPLPIEQRCISPSDFGFHNALKTNNSVRFLDFEYAGWDDPAKMAGDFFSQLAVPVPEGHFDYFIEKSMSIFPRPEELIERSRLLSFAYQVKWCCIALNIFLPHHLARRKFAMPNLDVKALRRTQLKKAGNLMDKIKLKAKIMQ